MSLLTWNCSNEQDSLTNPLEAVEPMTVKQSTYQINPLEGGTFVVTTSRFCQLSAYQFVPLNHSSALTVWTTVDADKTYHQGDATDDSSDNKKEHTFVVNDLFTVVHRYSNRLNQQNEFIVSLSPQSTSYQFTLSFVQKNGLGGYAFVNATK
jgi:hypothetical protein